MRLQFVEPCLYNNIDNGPYSTYKYIHNEANGIEIETGRLSSAIRFQRVAQVVAQKGGSEEWLRGVAQRDGSVVWLRGMVPWCGSRVWLKGVAQRGGSLGYSV